MAAEIVDLSGITGARRPIDDCAVLSRRRKAPHTATDVANARGRRVRIRRTELSLKLLVIWTGGGGHVVVPSVIYVDGV